MSELDWSDLPSLFDGLEAVGSQEKQKTLKSIARGACPFCSAEAIGLVRSPDGLHLAWRMHNLVTHAGTRVPCQSTGQHLCDAPARPVPGVTAPACLHARNH
jgi:hypothetical protein